MPCILVKNLPAIWGTWVPSLGGEDPLEEGMATHSSILAWRIPWTRETGGLQSMGLQRVRQGWAMDIFTFPCAHESEEWASWKQVISWLSRAIVCTSLKESRERSGDEIWSQDPEVLSPHLFLQRRERKTWALLAASGAGQPGSIPLPPPPKKAIPAWIHTPLPQRSHPPPSRLTCTCYYNSYISADLSL